VKLISENKTNLSNHYKVGAESWDKVKLFYNKTESYPLVEKLKIPCPKTFVVSNQKELNELSKTVEYPVIIKPSVMMDFYRQFRKKVIQCNCPEELINNYKTAVSRIKARDILVQEVIPGSSDNLYSVGVNMHNGNSINAIVVRRSRQHPIMYGNATTYAETVDLPELLKYAKKLLNYVDYSGLAEVEFKYDKRDGKYKFLEVIPRTWKWHIITQKANIPLLENYYNIQYGLPVVEEKTVQASWRHDLLDQIVKLGMRYKRLSTKQQKQEKISAVWSSADFWPGVFEYLYLPYNLIKRR
jgi:predicted ATP-grasp superfamily ATP-dependent carboligase